MQTATKERRHAVVRPVQSGGSVNATVLSSAVTDAGNEVVNTFERGSGGCATNCVDNVIVLDSNGNELCGTLSSGAKWVMLCTPQHSLYSSSDYNNNSTFTLFGFDEVTGVQKFSIVIPFSYGGQFNPFRGFPRSPGRQCFTCQWKLQPLLLLPMSCIAESFARRYPDLVSVTTASQCSALLSKRTSQSPTVR